MTDNKSLILDFGGVFLNLHPERATAAFQDLGFTEYSQPLALAIEDLQRGDKDAAAFREVFRTELGKPVSDEAIDKAWNSILGELPMERLSYLMDLKREHDLYLLSNIDEIHMAYLREQSPLFDAFEDQFISLHYSYEMGYRKPEEEIYMEVLHYNGLAPHECIFVDDLKENISAAQSLGIASWHLDLSLNTFLDFKPQLATEG